MNQIVGYLVILVIVVALLGGNANYFLNIFLLFFILGAAFQLLFRRRLPKSFGGNVALLVYAPTIALCLISIVFSKISDWQFSVNWFVLLFVIISVIYSWYGWRRWQDRTRRNQDQFNMRGSERDFIVPFQDNAARNNRNRDGE